ncbi:MAG TPA: hypothetical protein VK498_15325 [Ferruginibacter sp.]|nr:hypothetical protein [Ferruginibacter sp.]
MNKLANHCFWFLSLLILLNSCSKEYSCEDCYILKQLPIDCQAIQINGVFRQAQGLDASNYIEITVQFNKPGYYYFLTEKVNGISFSAVGNYTVGLQIIKLMGTGTPTQSGIFNYKVNNNISCAANILVENQPSPSNVFYYSATIDGVQYEAKALDTNGITAWGAVSALLGNNYETALKAVVGHNTWPPSSGYTGLMIYKGWIPQYPTATDAQIKDFLKPGSYSFADPNWVMNPPFKNGVSIVWYDLNGKSWYSDPSDDQTGRSFKITSSVDGPPSTNSNYQVTITAEFNCKLYNSNGDVKTLTNGKFFGFTGRY